MHNTSLFLSGFLVYVLFCIGLSYVVSRKQSSNEDFLLGGRGIPMFLILGTTVATMVGTGSSMGAVGFGYANGWAGMLYGIGGAIGILLLGLLFASVRKLNFMTMSEELSYYVGGHSWVKNLVALLVFIASIGWLGAHIIGGGLYLSWVSGIDMVTAKILVAAGFALYIMIGGYTAVVWTDTLQAIVLFIGFILMAYFAVDHIGGFAHLYDGMDTAATHFLAIDKLGAIPALSLAMVICVGVLATPSFRQRIYSSKDTATARTSFFCTGVLYLLFSIIPAIIGMAVFVINPNLEQSNYAFPYLAGTILPVGVGLIVLIAGLSATMSSASSDAIAGVSVLCCDLYPMVTGKALPESPHCWSSRLSVVLVVGAALLLSLNADNVIKYIGNMITTLMSGMCVCGLLGRFWPRYNWQGAIATLVAASATSFAVITHKEWFDYWGNACIPSLLAALLFGILFSLLWPASTVSKKEALEKLAQHSLLNQSH